MGHVYDGMISRLPEQVRNCLPLNGEGIQEIRLTSGAAVGGILKGKTVAWGNKPLTSKDIQECLYCLCGHALPAYENQLAQGYFTVEGCRVGVSGQLRYQNGIIKGYSVIQGLNIRIPYENSVALPQEVTEYIEEKTLGGILVAGPPGSGKTTFLLSMGKYLAQTNRRTVVIDEKQELRSLIGMGAPFLMGFAQCKRTDGILYGLRGCNPEFILCDEIATSQDVEAIAQGLGAGVRFIATIHACGREELEKRIPYRALQPGCFGMVLLLGDCPGTPFQVMRT